MQVVLGRFFKSGFVRGSGGLVLALAVGHLSGCVRTKPPSLLPPGSTAQGSAEGQAPTPGQGGAGKVRVQVSAGAGHSCALVANGNLYCWGDNSFGQLGDGTMRSRQAAGVVRGPDAVVAVSSGRAHTCAIDAQAQLWCWGDNRFGQLGLGPASLKRAVMERPARVAGIEGGVRSVVAGGQHTCAVSRSGQLYCWGDNGRGQLGKPAPAVFAQPMPVDGTGSVKQVALGRAHTCVLRKDDVMLCWGDNRYGQLGTQGPEHRYRPSRLQGLAKGTQIAAGGDQSCAATASGVMCWGAGSGPGAPHVAKRVASLNRVHSLSIGRAHGCLLDMQNRPFCWGQNGEGQLGDGSTRDSARPRPVAQLRSAIALSAGLRHSCAANEQGQVFCWGSDGFSALGATPSRAPAQEHKLRSALLLQPAKGLSLGRKFACSVLDTGGINCWGDNSKGQLGTGAMSVYSAKPAQVLGIQDATKVVAGAEHACALRKTGHVQCWGSNLARQIGDDRVKSKIVRRAKTVTRVRDIVDIAAGDAFTCALSRQGQVYCWGASMRGQLGRVGKGFSAVSGLSGVKEIQAGAEHACAITRTGTMYCWGDNRKGQLGSNLGAKDLNQPVSRPMLVKGVTGVSSMALGDRFSCAVSQDRRVYCWGDNRGGQVGNGTATDVWMMPVPVANLRNVSVLGAGSAHACASQADWIYCWGRVPPSDSGGASTVDARKPARAVSMGAAQIAGGMNFSCALGRDGDVGCWGKEQAGELGRGMRGFSDTPLRVTGL